MTREAWLRTHPFLEPVARLHARVESALADLPAPAPAPPGFDDYLGDYGDGIPLLRSARAAVDLQPGGEAALALIDRLAAGQPGDGIAPAALALHDELRRDPAPAQRIADWLLGEGGATLSHPCLLRYLGWTAMRRSLQPVLDAFAGWRDEDRWQRNHCPGCGSAPAMAQLVGVDPGFMRFLSCACCGTRWRWRRTACPFCEHDPHRLAVVKIESEPALRIDHCKTCRGYLKAYVGQGHESVMLADWTSLHLDLIARDRRLERKAASLYDLDTLLDLRSEQEPV